MNNESENISKQDCETKAFKRLSESLKKMFPRLPMCILGDSLYASEPFMKICEENKWEWLIRYKEGSIPSIAQEYEEISKMDEIESRIVFVDEVKKGRLLGTHRHHIQWVNELEYKGYKVNMMVLDIDRDEKKNQSFQWLSSLEIRRQTAVEFAKTGRQRWLIENEGFNMQKNKRYMITHQNSNDYQALQNHYLITQIADMLVQLYEYGFKGIRELNRIVENVAKGLLESLRKEDLSEEDLIYKRRRIEKNIE